MLSIKIVKSETVSINFFDLIRKGKKSISEFLKKDLAVSCDLGIKNKLNKSWIINNNIEILNKFSLENKRIDGLKQVKLGKYFSAMSLDEKYQALNNFLNYKMDVYNG